MRIHKESTRGLDKLDRHILRILQQEGRISMKDLGERVGLSVTPCIERVKRMERDGVITGYYAKVDAASLGAKLLVFVEITLNQKSASAFESAAGFRCVSFAGVGFILAREVASKQGARSWPRGASKLVHGPSSAAGRSSLR